VELVDEHLNPDALARTGLFKVKAVEALLNKVRVSDLTRLGTRDNMAFVQMLSTQILHRRFLSDDVSSMARARLPGLHVKTRLRMKPDLCNTNALSTSC
jgi:asparagine synthase (glutamine-hydrolysing)